MAELLLLQVRMIWDSAYAQHLMTKEMMQKFTVVAAHVVETLIPMIQDAFDELLVTSLTCIKIFLVNLLIKDKLNILYIYIYHKV